MLSKNLRATPASGPGAAPATQPTAQLLSLSELSRASDPGAPKALPDLGTTAAKAGNPLHNVKARLTVQVGTAQVTVGELLNATEDQVIRLDRLVDGPVDILLEGQVIARGTLVAVGEHFGVRVTELPKPLTP